MKLIIVLISIIAFASSDTSDGNSILTLKEVFTKAFEERNNELTTDGVGFTQLFFDADRECVIEKLNLAENGEKSAPTIFGTVIVSTASTLCSREHYKDIVTNYFNDIIEKLSTGHDAETTLYCISKKLQEVQDGADQNPDENCQQFDRVYLKISKELRYNSEMVKMLGIFDCVNFDNICLKSRILEAAISHMNEPRDEEAFANLRSEYFRIVRYYDNKIVECLMTKFNEGSIDWTAVDVNNVN